MLVVSGNRLADPTDIPTAPPTERSIMPTVWYCYTHQLGIITRVRVEWYPHVEAHVRGRKARNLLTVA